MKQKRKYKKSVLLRLLVLCVSLYMVFTLASLWRTLNESRVRLDELKKEYKLEQNEVEELKALLDGGSQEQIIEKAARDRLGYVFSDEEIYIDISGN